MGLAARPYLTWRPGKTKGDDRKSSPLGATGTAAAAARDYCAAAGPDAGVAGFGALLDSSGDSVSGVPEESGILSDAFSSVGATSDGGVSCCCMGFAGKGGTVGR